MNACILNFHPLTHLLSVDVRFKPDAQTHPCLMERAGSQQTQTNHNKQVCIEISQRFHLATVLQQGYDFLPVGAPTANSYWLRWSPQR